MAPQTPTPETRISFPAAVQACRSVSLSSLHPSIQKACTKKAKTAARSLGLLVYCFIVEPNGGERAFLVVPLSLSLFLSLLPFQLLSSNNSVASAGGKNEAFTGHKSQMKEGRKERANGGSGRMLLCPTSDSYREHRKREKKVGIATGHFKLKRGAAR